VTKDIQAKHLDDRAALEAVAACDMPTEDTMAAEVAGRLRFPPKVVAAKLRALQRRGLIREAGRMIEVSPAGCELLRAAA